MAAGEMRCSAEPLPATIAAQRASPQKAMGKTSLRSPRPPAAHQCHRRHATSIECGGPLATDSTVTVGENQYDALMNSCIDTKPVPLPTHRADSGLSEAMCVTRSSPAAAKIALFRSLFRGRSEVYPRRFERPDRAGGYIRFAVNGSGICEKPRTSGDCPNQRFLPITDEVVRWHLSGQMIPAGRS